MMKLNTTYLKKYRLFYNGPRHNIFLLMNFINMIIKIKMEIYTNIPIFISSYNTKEIYYII